MMLYCFLQQVTLSSGAGGPTGAANAEGHVWDEFDLTAVSTDTVKITATSVYSGGYCGLIEVEFYVGTSEYSRA